MKNNPNDKHCDATKFIDMVLKHDFSCLSENNYPFDDILADNNIGIELASSIKTLALEYKDSLMRAEEIVSDLVRSQQLNDDLLARQSLILDNSLVGIILVKDRTIMEASRKMAEMFGYQSPEELKGKSTRLMYRSDQDFAEIGSLFYSQLVKKADGKIEFIAKRKNGSEFWCMMTGKNVKTDEYSVWVIQDIDESKKAIRDIINLEENNEKLIKRQNLILNNSVVGIVLLAQRKILQANRKMAEMFGYDSPDELIGEYTRVLYRSDADYEGIGERCYPVIFNGEEYSEELIGRKKDGSEFWCLLTGKLVDAGDSDGADSVWIYQDIDENKRQEESLRKSKGLYSAIISNMADALFVVDINKKIISFNQAFASMFDLEPGTLAGESIYEIFNDEVIGLVNNVFSSRFEDDNSLNKTHFFSKEIGLLDGRTGKAVITPMFVQSVYSANPGDKASNSKSGSMLFSGAVASIRDITKEKEIDAMKTDFISTVSHELRTPLTSIIGFANIIRKKFNESLISLLDLDDKKTKRVSDQIASNLDIIINEGKRLTALINDVLDIAKMEAGKTDWKDESFQIKSAIEHSVSSTVSLFEQKGLKVEINADENLPEIFGDKDRYIQVIINLISNAVKFTDEGTISCEARLDGGAVLVSVKDQGIGISKENAEKVFDKFKQVGDTLTDKPKGTGLGLPICKQIVEHYGGKIWVESEIGQGSTFCFTVPLKDKPASVEGHAEIHKIDLDSLMHKFSHIYSNTPESELRKNLILVVDDDHAIRGFLTQELEGAGYAVDTAADGMEALAKVKQNKYSLIILDVMMPGLSGFDLSAILKSDPLTMETPLMIHSILEDRKRGYRAGVDSYITKGLDSDSLLKEVRHLVSRGSSRRKVFVIDKDESIFNMLTSVMEGKGYTVMGISEGSGGNYSEKIKNERPDIIIIDELVPCKQDILDFINEMNESGNMSTFVIIGNKINKE